MEADETFEHIANDCPRFYTFRREYFYDTKISNDHLWNVKNLIDFSYLPGINDALEGDTGIEWFGYGDRESSAGLLEDNSGIG